MDHFLDPYLAIYAGWKKGRAAKKVSLLPFDGKKPNPTKPDTLRPRADALMVAMAYLASVSAIDKAVRHAINGTADPVPEKLPRAGIAVAIGADLGDGERLGVIVIRDGFENVERGDYLPGIDVERLCGWACEVLDTLGSVTLRQGYRLIVFFRYRADDSAALQAIVPREPALFEVITEADFFPV
jgi:hypothetical protein